MIEVRCYESLEAAALLREDVNALNRAAARPDPFSTFEFLENYLRNDEGVSDGRPFKLWFLTAFQGGRLIGYLPLALKTPKAFGVTVPVLGLLVTHDTDRPHLVAATAELHDVGVAFRAYVLGRKREWSLLELQQQDEASPLLPSCGLEGYRLRQWASMENCTLHIRWASLREYYRALRKKFRSNVGRQLRNLFAAGDLQLLASSDPAVTPLLFDLYRSIEPHSWKSRANASVGRHPTRIEYFRGLLDSRQPMRISIQILLLNGAPIAGLISGAFMQGLYALHIVYDDRLQHLAPGSAILLLGVRQAIDGRYAFLNMLSGFGYFKARWLAQITETRVVQLYRTGSLLSFRRRLGDLKRSLVAAESKTARLLFNPTRRAVDDRDGDVPAPAATPVLDPGDDTRRCVTAAIDAIRFCRGEYLSAADLAAVLPFETSRYADGGLANGLPHGRARSSGS